ncbi:peripheral-type benzodiazepine receptor-associated protein 1 [Pelodiscus sinensis]|uniref:peripheral-type benzodiazepine receptor-associated protein 1 n=1 Tax=Pelodiscus sinensis TaxID=13735 RepID=UPI003F6CDC53
MEKQEERKPQPGSIQVSPCQGSPAWHSRQAPEAPVRQDSALGTDLQEDGALVGDSGNRVAPELTSGAPEPGLEEIRNTSVLAQSQVLSGWPPGHGAVLVQPLESRGPRGAMEGLGHCQAAGSSQGCAGDQALAKHNALLLRALQELQRCCASLKEENGLLRKSCFPATEEKVKHLKRKNAELALIAKRLEERARKLQEANLKVVNAPAAGKGSGWELCRKACARQRAKDLTEQASALLAKDKQIEALQQECRELHAKVTAGKEGLRLLDFHRLLRESQQEVLRLQRQIALKNFKETLHSAKTGSKSSSSSVAMCSGPAVPTPGTSPQAPSLSKGLQLGAPTLAMGAPGKVQLGLLPLGRASEEYENFPPKCLLAGPESNQQVQQLEFELRKKRKKCENLEHEVRKKHKRCKELETQLQAAQGENVRLAQENTQLKGKAEWAQQVDSENAALKLQVLLVTKERDSALQESQGLQAQLEDLEQHLNHAAERRQQLEAAHEEALLALQQKQEEVGWLQQAQAAAEREHAGAVQLLEARVQALEDQCRSHVEQLSHLSQELRRVRPPAGKSDPPTSAGVTPELPLLPCCCVPQPQCCQWEKEPAAAPARPAPQGTRRTPEEGREEPPIPDPASSATHVPASGAAAPSRSQVERRASQPSPSESDSVPESPTSCPTPEVDTASEMEDLDADSVALIPAPESHGPAKLQVFLARYSYNPLDGPNENPEAELPLTAGEYIYVYGHMDEDGFFEGELMDGRRGLVPSNFVERVPDDDLVAFLPPEASDLTQSSSHGRSTSSGEKSDDSCAETSASSSLSGPGDREESVRHTAVPYPRKLTLLKQLPRSIVVGWEPPLLPAGCPAVWRYDVSVDAELCQSVESGAQTQAEIENVDLERKAYRVSVQSVAEHGRSDALRCTLCVGPGVCPAPGLLEVRSVTATSAELTWVPCDSNFVHAVYLGEEECHSAKPGVYWYTFRSLRPSTQYVAKVEARPPGVLWELPQERREQDSAVIHFTTPVAGSPDAPLDVQAEPGPSAGILGISWLPVTIDAEGSSNGVRVTGYAVYADGQKVMEVASPTAGSVLVELSQLQMFQMCREVSVRTMSLYGESADSVPAQIPPALLKASRHPSLPQAVGSPSLRSSLLHGEPRGSPPQRTPVACSPAQLLPPCTHCSDARSTASCLPGQSPAHLPRCSPRPSSPVSQPGAGGDPEPARAAEPRGPDEGFQLQGSELSGGRGPELARSAAKLPMETSQPGGGEPASARGREAKERPLCTEPLCPTCPAEPGAASDRDSEWNGSSAQEFARGSPGKKLRKEISRGDSSGPGPKVKREQEEKRADAGKWQLTLLAEHGRSSDLCDILEEEEEELCSDMPGGKRWDPGVLCSGESGAQPDPCDTDSEEEILERLQPQNCSKTLFSIPEVTEEEEEEEERVHVGKRDPPDFPESRPCHAGSRGTPLSRSAPLALPDAGGHRAYPSLPLQALREALALQRSREASDSENPADVGLSWTQTRGGCDWGCWEGRATPAGDTSPQWGRKEGGSSPDRARELAEEGRKKCSDVTKGWSHPAGGSLYRAQSLAGQLNAVGRASSVEGAEICGPVSQAHSSALPATPASPGSNSSSMEISIEYDSEEDQDLSSPSSPGRRDWPAGHMEESQVGWEGWSDCSSLSESAGADGRTQQKQQASGEEVAAEWAGSPVSCPEKEMPGADERGWDPEGSLAGWRRMLEPPQKGAHGAVLHTRASGNGDLRSHGSLGSPAQRGNESQISNSSTSCSGTDGPVRIFVALFDYDPVSMSPNPDAAEEELPFREGQVLKVCGEKDADGFYRGECAGRAGYIPCNMVSEVELESEEAKEELLTRGYVPAGPSAAGEGNGTFAPPPRSLTAPPPKPRRAKKAELVTQEMGAPPAGCIWQPGADPSPPRSPVAALDGSPRESSPHVAMELNAEGPGERRDPWPPSCTAAGTDPSPGTLEPGDLATQGKRKKSFFCKGRKLLKKLGPSKKN